jgi:hypothetical protein
MTYQQNEIELAKAARLAQAEAELTKAKVEQEERVTGKVKREIGDLARHVTVKSVVMAKRNKFPHKVTLNLPGHRDIVAYVYQVDGVYFSARGRFWGAHEWRRSFVDALIDAEVK